jgi:hypothetical protein
MPPALSPSIIADLAISECHAGRAFRPEAYLEAAAALQALPQARAIEVLREWAGSDYYQPDATLPVDLERQRKYAQTELYERQVIALCRMLFEAPPGKNFRAPFMAQSKSFGNLTAADWPLAPIALVDGVPFWILNRPLTVSPTVTVVAPRPDERAAAYLDYCLKEMQWTSRRYAPIASAALHASLEKLLHNPIWSGSLSPTDENLLAEQLTPQSFPRFQLGIISVSAGTRYYTSSTSPAQQDSRVLPLNNSVDIHLVAGRFPYVYRLIWSDGSQPESLQTYKNSLRIWMNAAAQTTAQKAGGMDPDYAETLFGNHSPGTSLTVEVSDKHGDHASVAMDFNNKNVTVHEPSFKSAHETVLTQPADPGK